MVETTIKIRRKVSAAALFTYLYGPCSVMVARHTCTVTEEFESHMCPRLVQLTIHGMNSVDWNNAGVWTARDNVSICRVVSIIQI